MWCTADITMIPDTCAKGFLDSNFDLVKKYQIFTKLPKFHIFKKIVIFKA